MRHVPENGRPPCPLLATLEECKDRAVGPERIEPPQDRPGELLCSQGGMPSTQRVCFLLDSL